ncbi:MAG: ester cyclase [Anaerolineae bacterium]|nr:ester cyclase [Anaerolineae bacterium]
MSSSLHLENKHTLWKFWQALDNADLDQSKKLIVEHYDKNTDWNGSHPINRLQGTNQLFEGFWAPLKQAVPDLKRKVDILIAGQIYNKNWVTSTGYLNGTFVTDWLGIPTKGKSANIRYGEFCALKSGKIIETYVLFDLLDVMRQIGHPALPLNYSGIEGLVPGPATKNGVLLVESDADESQKSLKLVEAMLKGLKQYDQEKLESMGQHNYWHNEKLRWYGPSGIGTTHGLKGFEDHHQRPFLKAFPDRVGGNHKARFGEAHYTASTGWPSMVATHAGSYLGVPATGKKVTMRIMDWWRREAEWLVENWVLIDLPDLFLQFGVDLLDRSATAVKS